MIDKNYVDAVKPRKGKAFTIINCEENPLKMKISVLIKRKKVINFLNI